MFSVFFKQNKNRRYNYTPRYYDERKERLDNLKRKHGLIEDDSKQEYRRTSFRDEWKQNSKIKSNQNTRIRLFVILIFLLSAAYIAIDYLGIKLF
jgi:hypothetical protein